MNATKILKDIRMVVAHHSPEILTGIGIAGMITTTVLAVKATPKAIKLIEEEHKSRKNEEVLPSKDVVKTCWKCYIPAAVTGVASIACLIGASSVSARRNAAIATAYKLSETALSEYREKVIETIGEKKEKEVREAVAEDKIKKNPVSNNGVIVTGKGDTLCCDLSFGRYFWSDIDKLKKIENELNRRMRDEIEITLNDFYYEVGLDGVDSGDDVGWNIDKGYIELGFSSHLSDDGRPCLAIQFVNPPKYIGKYAY